MDKTFIWVREYADGHRQFFGDTRLTFEQLEKLVEELTPDDGMISEGLWFPYLELQNP